MACSDFHAVAVQLGGLDNGQPGLRLQYGADYFAAFVIDPDGYAIETVFNGPESGTSMERE